MFLSVCQDVHTKMSEAWCAREPCVTTWSGVIRLAERRWLRTGGQAVGIDTTDRLSQVKLLSSRKRAEARDPDSMRARKGHHSGHSRRTHSRSLSRATHTQCTAQARVARETTHVCAVSAQVCGSRVCTGTLSLPSCVVPASAPWRYGRRCLPAHVFFFTSLLAIHGGRAMTADIIESTDYVVIRQA